MRPVAPPVPEEPDAPTPSLDRTLTWRMHTLHKITDQESLRRYPLEAGLSLSDGRCLTAIGSFGPLSVNELAQKANLNKAQASRAAQSLVDQGLVKKVDAPHDGRGVQLSLTARGRKAFARTMALVEQRNREIFGCLSPREQEQLAALLDRLIAHVQPPPGDEPEPEPD
ncbi:MarR family winged helix-turn-helix transcriptional regulator [Ramlibacter rhizophilus]|uniref:MarR family transcriptional regulator n=1 Tax=Ramlibacter rhizophilus TaxID=1781167 RepID=A0A4Z0BDB4_9BURK|nr:MarR family winged helix-turn-helix transcriptional regulator [Ramlibacter rhizophilus]TFY97296.1 MarR family transcriptional regulator [Ramlibacter rhizophilus]